MTDMPNTAYSLMRRPTRDDMTKTAFDHLFTPEEAEGLEIRATLLGGIQDWLKRSGLSQAAAAEHLGVSQARISEIKNGKISRFTIDKLIAIASRAGLHPRVELVAA